MMSIIAYGIGAVVIVIMFLNVIVGFGKKADNQIEKILKRREKNEKNL